MSEILLIMPGNFSKVADPSVLPYGAEYYEQFHGTGVNADVTQQFIDAGIIAADQVVQEVRYVRETGELWYALQG